MNNCRQTFNISFVCRASKANKNGLSPIEMTINISGERVYLQLPYKVTAAQFKKDISSKRMNEIRKFTADMYSKAQSIVADMLRDGKELSASSVKAYMVSGYSSSCARVCDIFNEYLEILKKRTGTSLGMDAYKRYQLTTELFYSVCRKDKELSEVKQGDILLYKAEVDKRYKGSTAYGYMSRLKSFFLYAIGEGYITANPFNGLKLSKCVAEVKALSVAEVKKLEDTEFGIDSTERVKDCFLFQCYTGLSYIDMKSLGKDDIKYNEDNKPYISKKRAKTGVLFTVPLIDKAMSILERYEYKLPVISNQKMNLHLHTIGEVCLGYKLHTHLGRHTAATILLNRGVPVEVVSKVLGHSRIVQTQHYAKVLNETIFDAFSTI